MEKRAVLVTGSSSGIGREIVLLLAARGHRVFAGVRRAADGDALVRAASGNLTPVPIDVTDESAIRAAVQTVSAALAPDEAFGLVNNAGIVVAGPLELLPMSDLRSQFEVNVLGQVAVTQAFLPLLRSRRGRIVFMGSLFGKIAPPFVAPYASAKHAMEAIADAFAVELAPWKIGVSLLEPGNIATPIWHKGRHGVETVYGGSAPEKRDLYKDAQGSMLRLLSFFGKSGITPERVAGVVERALTTRRPRSRYLVGADAKFFGCFVPYSPDRLRYWVFRRLVAPR